MCINIIPQALWNMKTPAYNIDDVGSLVRKGGKEILPGQSPPGRPLSPAMTVIIRYCTNMMFTGSQLELADFATSP